MKIRNMYIYCFLMLFILVSTSFFIDVEAVKQNQDNIVTIKVGIYSESSFFGAIVTRQKFLDKGFFPYEWEVENKIYRIETEKLTHEHLQGINSIPNDFNVILWSGGGNENIFSGMRILRYTQKMINVKQNIENFIKKGKGYVGHCGGSMWPATSNYQYQTRFERQQTWNSFITNPANPDVKEIKFLNHEGFPMISEYLYLDREFPPFRPFGRPFEEYIRKPSYIGSAAYIFYMGNQVSGMAGIPFNLKIRNKDHPLLKDYNSDTIRMLADGGLSYTVPKNPDICDLAGYTAEEEPYDNEALELYSWGFKPKTIQTVKSIISFFRWVRSEDF